MTSHQNNQRHPAPLRQRFFSLPTLLSFAAAIALIYFLAVRFDLDWEKTWANVRTMDPGFYVLALLLYYLSFGFRGLRWRVLAYNAATDNSPAARLPPVLTFSQLIVIGWFVNAVAWLRLGDAYRAYALSRRSGTGFSWSLGTVLGERVMDMVTVFVLAVVGVGWFSVTRDSAGAGYILLAAISMAAALAIVLALMKGYGTRVARLLPLRLESAYHRFHQGTLGSLKQLPLVFGLGLAGWLLEVGRLYFVVQALGLEAGVPLILIVALGHAILSIVPTPGGVGAVEPGVTGLLILAPMVREDAVSIALVDRSITYLSVIVLGGLAFLLWQAANAQRERPKTLAAGQARGRGESGEG